MALINFPDLWLLDICGWIFPEVSTKYERHTRGSNCHCQFSDNCGISRLVEKCCKVKTETLNYYWKSYSLWIVTLVRSLIYWFRFLSPLSIVPYISFVGLGMYHLGFPMVNSSWSFILCSYISFVLSIYYTCYQSYCFLNFYSCVSCHFENLQVDYA